MEKAPFPNSRGIQGSIALHFQESLMQVVNNVNGRWCHLMHIQLLAQMT